MTCPTCRGFRIVKWGIGVITCPTCNGEGKIKKEKFDNMKDTTIAKIVFLLCLLAAIFMPERGRAQSGYRLIKHCGEYSPKQVDSLLAVGIDEVVDTCAGNLFRSEDGGIINWQNATWLHNVEAISKLETKKDTVLVDVLCLYAPITTGAESIFTKYTPNVRVEQKRQERTFRETPLQPPYKRDPFLGHTIVWEWRLVEIRWLDPVDGCYQFVPLKD